MADTAVTSDQRRGSCAECIHFRNDPATLEAAFPGLGSLSSARGSVRGDDGVCFRHDRYLSAHSSCEEFRAATFTGYPA